MPASPERKRRKVPCGFVEGSDAHEAAALVGWPLVPLGRGDEHLPAAPQGDLFAPRARGRWPSATHSTSPGSSPPSPLAWGGDAPADRAGVDTDAENTTPRSRGTRTES